MTETLYLGSRDYRWTVEVIYRDRGTGQTHLSSWFCTACAYEQDNFRYKIAIEGFFKLLGWEFISFRVRKLPPARTHTPRPVA